MSLELRSGQRLKWGGIGYQVLDSRDDKVTLMSDRSGVTKQVSLSQLVIERDAGEIKFSAPPIDLETAPLLFATNREAIGAQIERRRQYVEALMLEGVRGSRRRIGQVVYRLARERNDPAPPSVTTAHKWLREYRTGQQDLQRLVPKHAGKGNRTPRVTETVLAFFHEVVDTFYLQRNQPSAAYAHERLTDKIHLHNEKHPKDRQKTLSYKAFTRMLRRYVDPYWSVVRREGPAAARRKFRGTGDGIVSTYPMERIEVDHTILDVLVVNPVTGEVVGRPTLTWALDHYSRVILGFVLSFHSPKAILVNQCLELVMQDKTPKLAELGITASRRWDMHGRPNFLVLDNGAEFHSHTFQASCADLAISLQYCPPGQPWFKGRTERFVGTLNTGLVHLLPGTTRSNPKARGSYKSEALAILTLKEVETLITRFIVEIYHERRHSGLGMTPRQAWEEGIQEHPPSVVHNPETLKLALATHHVCTINTGRVQFKNLRYASPMLAALETQLGKNNREVTVLSPLRDISVAHVLDPIRKCYLEVPCVTHGVTPGMTLDEFILLGKVGKDQDTDMNLIRTRDAFAHELQETHTRAEKKAARERKDKKSTGRASGLPRKPNQSSEMIGPLNRKEVERLRDYAERTPPPQISSPANANRSPFDYDLNDDVI